MKCRGGEAQELIRNQSAAMSAAKPRQSLLCCAGLLVASRFQLARELAFNAKSAQWKSPEKV